MAEGMPRVEVKSSPPVTIQAGPFEFRMVSRRVNQDHGGTLEVYGQVAGERHELLKFDCFANGPHWHRCYPGKPDVIAQLAPADAAQALAFSMETLRGRFAPLIAEQGFESLSGAAAGAEVGSALSGVEATMAELIQRDPATL